MSTVLHVAIEVNTEVGAIRESDASKFFTSVFVSGVDEGFGAAALIATPLFQTRFFPDLMQVNFLPDAVAVDPALVHLAPALGVAAWTGATRDKSKKAESVSVVHFFTGSTTYLLVC
jgi:hypothetical protein